MSHGSKTQDEFNLNLALFTPQESVIFRTINEYLYHVSGFLYYFSATVNPILYNLMSLKYRHAFKQTLCGRRGTGTQFSSKLLLEIWRENKREIWLEIP